MKPKDFDCITFYDLDLKLNGYLSKFKSEREITRFVAYSAHIAPHLDRKHVAKLTLEKFLPFDWDSGSEPESNDFESKKEGFKELMKQINGNG